MSSDRRIWLAGLALLGALVCVRVGAHFASSAEPNGAMLANLFGQAVWGCLSVSGALVAVGLPVSQRLGLRAGLLPVWTCALLIVGFAALSYALHLHLTAVSLRDTGTMGQIDRMVARARGPSPALTLFTVGVAPAFAEELLFRGLLQRGFSRWLGPWLAVPLAAAVFGAAHWDPVHSPAAVVLGLYLGVVAALAGSIRPAIACHLANNLLGVLLNPAAGGLGAGLRSLPIPALLALAAAALGVAVWVSNRVESPKGGLGGLQRGPCKADERGPGPAPGTKAHEQPTLDTPDR